MNGTYPALSADRDRFAELGWDVKDEGRMVNMKERGRDFYALSLFGGRDDGHRVTVFLTYRESPRTGTFLFDSANFYWPDDDVRTRVTTKQRTRHLIELYAPNKEET